MNILVIGTSHSVSSCKRYPSHHPLDHGNKDIMLEGRWHDLLGKHYGADVFTLARSGCSIEDQIDKVYAYNQVNPKKQYDLAIVEGRRMQSSIGVNEKGFSSPLDFPCEETYLNWTDGFRKLHGDTGNKLDQISSAYSNHIQKQLKQYGPWFVDYVDSYLQAVQVWSMNLALCSLLETFCDKVLWYTFNGNNVSKFGEHAPLNTMGYQMLKKYALFTEDTYFNGVTSFHAFANDPDNKLHCHCHHLNELGHHMLFNDILKPRLDELKIFK